MRKKNQRQQQQQAFHLTLQRPMKTIGFERRMSANKLSLVFFSEEKANFNRFLFSTDNS